MGFRNILNLKVLTQDTGSERRVASKSRGQRVLSLTPHTDISPPHKWASTLQGHDPYTMRATQVLRHYNPCIRGANPSFNPFRHNKVYLFMLIMK